jgi:uncharacterized protein with HEPN domain
MKGRSDKILLFDIVECCQRIAEYVDGIRKKDFEANYQLQDALVRKLEVIGEAAKGLSDNLRDNSREIPWQQLMGMRDRMIHQYFRVDLDIVWKTAKKDIPPLERQVAAIYSKMK